MIFKEKYLSGYILLTDQIPNFIVWVPLLHEILGNMRIVIVSLPGFDVMNFEINFTFVIKPFFLHDQNIKRKT